ncbi:MAG: FAD-dependent oxidoreductase [Bacillota bacterium]
MAKRTLVIAGGVAAGMSAASRARRLDPGLEIMVFEASGHVSYGSCGLPYLISGVIPKPEDLVVYTPQFFLDKRNIRVFTHHTVTALDPSRKQVRVRRPDGTLQDVGYDRFILTTGGRAARPPIEGIDLPGVFTLRTLEDGVAILDYLSERQPRKAVIVGGGYIGLEMAEAFRARGLEVAVVEMLPQVMATLDPDMAALVAESLQRNGVALYTGEAVTGLEGDAGGVRRVHTTGRTLEADLVLLAGGVKPNVTLAAEAGLRLGPTGAVAVNERLETGLPDIWAAGDVAEVNHLVTGAPAYIPLGTTANKQGRVAGENAAGGRASFGGVVGTAVAKVFDLEVARTGLTLAEAERAGFDPVTATVKQHSRAHYYPGGAKMSARLIIDRPSGRLLGAQMVGTDGVSKRIDVPAAALHAGWTVEDLYGLDLSYAPPFAPVWDPVLMAAREGLKAIGAIAAD